MTECAPSSSGRSSAAPCYSLRRRLQVGDKWAQKTVPALAQLSVSSVSTAGVGACVGVGRGAIRSTTIQFGWRRHGPLLKWEKAVWRRQHGWRRVSSSDGAPRPPQTSNSRPHPALLTRTDICLSHSQVARHSPLTPRNLYGARLQGHGRRTSGHHTHYSGGAPSLRRADVRACRCMSRGPRKAAARSSQLDAGGSTLAGGWTCVGCAGQRLQPTG